MKALWYRIKEAWLSYWEDDSYNDGVKHLSKSDKRWLIYGALMICLFSTAVTALIMNASYARYNDQYEKELYDFLNTVATYVGTATDDEYDEIATELRDELVFTQFNLDNDIEMYMKYIINTSNQCPLDLENYSSRYYLVMTNNGNIQPIDNFGVGEDAESEYGYLEINHMWDEISETSISIMSFPDDKSTDISIRPNRGVVSAYRMKTIFCDDCIREIFTMNEDTCLGEVFIFDSESHILYPIKESTLELDSYTFTIAHNQSGGYNMKLLYTGGQ